MLVDQAVVETYQHVLISTEQAVLTAVPTHATILMRAMCVVQTGIIAKEAKHAPVK